MNNNLESIQTQQQFNAWLQTLPPADRQSIMEEAQDVGMECRDADREAGRETMTEQ